MNDEEKAKLRKKVKEPFIINWWPNDCYAHGNNDYEHYIIQWYDPKTDKVYQQDCCEAGCGNFPLSIEEEIEKFDNGHKEYWLSKGVDERLIIKEQSR